MKKLIPTALCLAILIGCMPEKLAEPTTEVGWFTPYVFTPEFMTGQVKSFEQRAYWATEEDGNYIQGALMTQKERDSIGWSDDFVAYFDSSGLLKKTAFLDDDGEPYGYYKVLAENGMYMKAKWFLKDTLRTYVVYSHDDAGNHIHMEQFNAQEDTLINTYDFKYDENGNWLGGQYGTYNGEAGFSHNLEYDDAGMPILRENFNADGEKVAWYKYTYNEKGLILTMEGLDSDSTTVHVEHKYTKFDEKGNWLILVSIEEGELVGMDVRTIEYY